MFDLHAVTIASDESDDVFVGVRVAAEFVCGCAAVWWANWTRGWRHRCRDHA